MVTCVRIKHPRILSVLSILYSGIIGAGLGRLGKVTLLSTYRRDFGKYAKYTQHKYLEILFRRIPGTIAQVFKYSHITKEVQSRELGQALDKLCQAGIVMKVHTTNASMLPLSSTLNEK